jgi:hypothetical protein
VDESEGGVRKKAKKKKKSTGRLVADRKVRCR